MNSWWLKISFDFSLFLDVTYLITLTTRFSTREKEQDTLQIALKGKQAGAKHNLYRLKKDNKNIGASNLISPFENLHHQVLLNNFHQTFS